MAEKGSLIAQVYTARMAIPVEGVSVTITTDDIDRPEIIAYRTTDLNGRTQPVELVTPDIGLTLTPSPETGFTTCNVQLDHPNYYSVLVEHVQVFPEIESIQQMEMVPLEEFAPEVKRRIFEVIPQDL